NHIRGGLSAGEKFNSLLSPEANAGLLWTYTTRKIVTNKASKAGLFPCSGLDETEVQFTWQATEFYKGCDYLKFGAF
ncbi:MAG: hypothetical protein ACOYLQ_13650, partial [Hyphomicrobiaceae bacterium]